MPRKLSLILFTLLASPVFALQSEVVPWASIQTNGNTTQATANIGSVPVAIKIDVLECEVQSLALSVGSETITMPPVAIAFGACPRPADIKLLYYSCCYAVVPSFKAEDEQLYLNLLVPLASVENSAGQDHRVWFSFTYKPGALRVLWPPEQP